VKGYEVAKDQYVVIEPEELEALDPRKTRTIDIQEFVELDEIDPVYYDSTYHLAPATGAAKAYGLLLAAMKDAGKVAIGRVVIRTKEYLAAIRPMGDALVLSTMLFGDEVVDPDRLDELPAKDGKPTKREVEMAQQLIESLTVEFDPGRHRDEYRERVLELIERKAAGEEISMPALERDEGPTPDLMAALEASLAEASGQAASNGGGRRKSGSRKSSKSPKASTKSSSSKRTAKKPGKRRATAGRSS
jgi:DNA end-binding protein Ku